MSVLSSQIGNAVGGYDMNVREAWQMGLAGRNVSISILDDGVQVVYALLFTCLHVLVYRGGKRPRNNVLPPNMNGNRAALPPPPQSCDAASR